MALRRRIRWVVRHGLVRRAVHRQMRAGDLGSRLMIDPAIREDPFPYYDQLRAQGRIVSSGLALITARHDVCLAVLRSPDFGPATPRPATRAAPAGHEDRRPPGPGTDRASIHAGDRPPDHTRYRKLVTRAFSARAVAAMRSRIEDIAEELLDDIARSTPKTRPDTGGPAVDLVARYASLLPATVIAEMLGAPVAMRRQFLDWGAGASLSLDIGLTYRDFHRSEHDLAALHRWMLDHFVEIRRAPRDDVLSALVTAHDQGDQLTLDG